MKRKTFAAVLVLMIAAFANALQSATEWVSYTSEEGRYTVLLPQQPKFSSQEATASNGEKFTQYMAQAGDSDSFYISGYFDYTASMVFSLDKARDGVLAATKGTLLKEDPISLGGNPGKELRFSSKNGEFELIHRLRFYDTGRRVYVIQQVFQKSSDTPALAAKTARFFDSFKALPVK